MVKNVYIFVEGGSISKDLARFRNGFSRFIVNEIGRIRGLRIIPCGSRGETYKKYMENCSHHHSDFNILLVDSEGPITKKPWKHLCESDHWPITSDHDKHCHLMVQMMESWFIADIDALASFYGPKFHAASLPKNPQIESISKQDVMNGLNKAVRNTPRGEYHKTQHSPGILALLDPSIVRAAAPHCDRLFKILSEKMEISS